jgi:pantoate--beta-alanine ligase
MGALHQGHLSLIRSALELNDLVVCSIFINPTQFNNSEDLRLYPVSIEKDIEQLLQAGCSILFLPAVEEIYPPGYHKKHYELGPVEHILEGHYRPGHFQGVAEVVDRLLDIVQPHNLYLGQKDFQQCIVIHKLIQLLGKTDQVHIHIVPTVREWDGLAMSSRNLRLTEDQRSRAAALFRELKNISGKFGQAPVTTLEAEARKNLEQQGFQVDYITITGADDLASHADGKKVVLVAATIGSIRLIDNLLLN